MIKTAFYDTKEYDKPSFEKYGQTHDIKFRFLETKLNEDTVELANGCDAVCVFVNDSVSAKVIERLYEMGVKLIALRSAGYNNVDVKAAFGKIHVVHVPAYSPYAVAEHAMALLLTSVRRIHKAYNRTRDFNFSLSGLTGFDLHGKTVGVIGTGRIGRIFIDICRGFGMNVIAYDHFPARDSGIEYVALDDLFRRSDIISLHCPLTDETRHMIGTDAIEKMKKGVVILNTSRGALIDAEALLEGITTATGSNYAATTERIYDNTWNFTITKAEVSTPTIASKAYNTEKQTADVAASDLYAVTTNEGGTNVGDYDVVLTLTDSTNYKWEDSEEAAKTLAFTITKATAPAVVVPTPAAVTYDSTKTLESVTLPDGWAWEDKTTVPTVNNNGYNAALAVDDTNYDYTGVDGYNSTAHEVTRTVTLTVNKAESSVTTVPPVNTGLVYKGMAQELVSAGTASGGTLNYVLGTDASTVPTSGWSTSIPTGTEANTYYVWYKVVGDENHLDTNPQCLTVIIKGYNTIDGEGQNWTKGSPKGAEFTFRDTVEDNTYGQFMDGGKMYLDGSTTPMAINTDFTARKGSLIITLEPSYLETLTAEKHTLRVVFGDTGEVTTYFYVKNKSTPGGGDSDSSASYKLPKTGIE